MDESPVGTPDSLSRSVSRVEMEPSRPKRSDDADACWLDAELTVDSCGILVVARTLQADVPVSGIGTYRSRQAGKEKKEAGCLPYCRT